MRVHTKLYPFKCTVCDKTYRTPSLLNYHMVSLNVKLMKKLLLLEKINIEFTVIF